MLVGQEAECARVDALLAGRGGVLVVRGGVGSGKSALLGYAAEHAGDFAVLRTRAIESEAELPFAGLGDLLRPILTHLDELPEAQAAALAGALAIGPPVAADPFAVCAAALGLLAAAGEEQPLLVLVDDAQWVDRSSLQALVFAARRLEAEAVAVLFAVRDGDATPLDGSGLEELRLGPPGDDETRALERELAYEIDGLPEEAQRLLVIAAASNSGDVRAIRAAAKELGIDPDWLDRAEAAGVVAVDAGSVRFRNPSLRRAAYGTAPARRAAHRALAGDAGDARAWHLAAAAGDRDEAAAAALEEAARAARIRGGHAEAAAAFERAAVLGANEKKRVGRLCEAVASNQLAGRADRARELAEQALAASEDPRDRARVQQLLALIEMWHGTPSAARALLVDEAARVEPFDPVRAASMLTDAAWAAFMAGDITAGLAVGERVRATGGGAAALGLALLLAGEPHRALPLLSDYAPERERPFRPEGQVLVWLEQYDQARELLTRAVDHARATSAVGALPYALACLSELDFRTGRWVAAYAGAAEAVRIADETGQGATLGFALSCLARVEAAQGRDDDCRSHVRRALGIADARFGAVVAFALAAAGLLELGRGRTDDAIERLELLARQVEERGLREPAVVQGTPDLVEAYARAGREDDARATLHRFEQAARKTARSWALAASARCRGLLAGDDTFEPAFAEALELHGAETPFERARTELCLGERRRRARRRADARGPLRSALETFERLGATPWAERARAELAACGETVQRGEPGAADELTPQELQVALIVARGATNKEAGAALFLSPKTIETHLGRVYRKLGVRTRTELAALLARS